MTNSGMPDPEPKGSGANTVQVLAPESAGDLRAFLRRELAKAFETHLGSGSKLTGRQRVGLIELVRTDSATPAAILTVLRRQDGETARA
jgi:hypothetical protein